jgi:hypothetical protein
MHRCWSLFLPTFICHSRVCFLRAFRKSYINFKVHIALLEKPNICQFHWLFNIKYVTLVVGWIGFSRRHHVLKMTFHSATRYLWWTFQGSLWCYKNIPKLVIDSCYMSRFWHRVDCPFNIVLILGAHSFKNIYCLYSHLHYICV